MVVASCSTSFHLPYWAGTKIWYFGLIWELVSVGNGTMRPMSCTHMLWDAPLICLVHLRMVRKHDFINNGYLSLWYIIPFAILRGYQQLWYFVCNLRVSVGWDGTLWPVSGREILPEASPICIMHLRKVLKHFISNGCPSYCSIMSHLSCSEGTKIWHFMFNLRADLDRKLHSATHMWERDTVRSISYLPYVSHKVLKYFMSNGWHSLQCSIPFAVLIGCLSEIWCFGVCNLRVDDHGNRQIKTHMWLTEAVRSFFHLYCASKDGFETLHK